ncbi:conjugative transposon protein TraK [Foetidibacter luteolus]|uniref:conjugative transposon protein TraK n=1 Tax=Foetidibacter luteolus TaxID=2608880 RepID=UPI00129B0E43|nr:conjugative transposon protein TraK [Foetidibacter luteolus]
MFTKMKSIEEAYRSVRRVMVVITIGCLLLCGYVFFRSYQLAVMAENKVYVLADGKALEALAGERKDNVTVEARDHISTFHHLFFSLEPDNKVIETNIAKALYLADGSAKKQYQDLRESGYYSGIISGNISQHLKVDSISLTMDRHPYSFRCYGVLSIVRSTNTTTRSLVTEGYLRNTSRSDNNPHGFLIEKWITVENKDLKTDSR